ncbi:MAG: TetR/AcrR family transcriptional regulator [Gammaproteobacteria bacterium]
MVVLRDKRDRLINAAKAVFYRQGVDRTTLADVASESGVPLGNVYYYFKSKADLVAAVISARGAETFEMFRTCLSEPTPKGRLVAVLNVLKQQAESLAEKGCPIGTLCLELGKMPSGLAEQADTLLKRQVDWVAAQFTEMGARDPKEMAMRMVAELQGIATLAKVYRDPNVARQSIDRMIKWVESVR